MHQEALEVAATVKDGKLTLVDERGYRSAIRRFADGDVIVTVRKARAKRTLPQNSFWHAVVIPAFAEHCGYDFYDMKDVLALKLLPKEIADLDTGEVRIVPGHTSELNVKQFNELIERAQRLGAEMGIYIPNPGEVAA